MPRLRSRLAHSCHGGRCLTSAPLPVAAALALAACAPPEAGGGPISEAARTAPPPRLGETAAFDAALASAEPDAEPARGRAADLAARAAALRARAAGLAGAGRRPAPPARASTPAGA